MFRRVAIVHDWLIAMRGGERVLESLCALYPSADIYTLSHDPARVSPVFARHRITTSFIDRLAHVPLLRGRFRGFLPLFPLAAESFRLDGYDLVISSSHCVAAGVLAPPTALHVAYVHSPMRYVWEAQAAYEDAVGGGALGKLAFRMMTHYLRLWDVAAASRPDLLIANSAYTRQRIRRYYGRDAEVIEPPIDTRRFQLASAIPAARATDDAPFLVVSALVPYKRVELAVQAMAGRPEHLVIVGEGSDRARLERMAGPNVLFRGWVSDAELVDLVASCRALLHPAVDDFGMVMVEALAAGKPVVASRDGGAAEIIRDGESGIFFDEPSVSSLRAALDRFAGVFDRFEPRDLRRLAERFDRSTFERRFQQAVERGRLEHPRPAVGIAGAHPPRARQFGLGRA
jgi:glycosyltransferase involved in cell wall biosynthesis